jgi:hypothetical protein
MAKATRPSDPATYSERMFSWFPLLFPLRQPVAIQVFVFLREYGPCIYPCRQLTFFPNFFAEQAGATIEVCMWRCVRDTKVRPPTAAVC